MRYSELSELAVLSSAKCVNSSSISVLMDGNQMIRVTLGCWHVGEGLA